MTVIIIADKPSHYRVDLFNAMSLLYGNDIFFFFTPDPRLPERNAISVFTAEPFLLHSFIFPYRSIVKRGLKLLTSIYKKKPDVIINVGMSLRLPFLTLYAKLFGKKLLVWWGGTKASEKRMSALKHLYRKFMFSFIDGVFCYSPLAEEYVHELAGTKCHSWVLGNNTLDSQRYHAEILRCRTALPQHGSGLRIITVGFLTQNKNISTLLRVYGALKNSYKEISLIIVGDGPDLPRLRSFVQEHDLCDVIFSGFIEHKEMPACYAEADIFVHPSILDRWPQTFNEAAAVGLPILISCTSGVANDYTEMYAETVLFDPYDESRLSSLLEELITNPNLRKKLGAAAQQSAFNVDCTSVVKKIDRILNGKYF